MKLTVLSVSGSVLSECQPSVSLVIKDEETGETMISGMCSGKTLYDATCNAFSEILKSPLSATSMLLDTEEGDNKWLLCIATIYFRGQKLNGSCGSSKFKEWNELRVFVGAVIDALNTRRSRAYTMPFVPFHGTTW